MNKPLEYCTLMITVPRHILLVFLKLMRCMVLVDTCQRDSWFMDNAWTLPVCLLCHFRAVAEFLWFASGSQRAVHRRAIPCKRPACLLAAA